MKLASLSTFVCPACHGELRLLARVREVAEVIEGQLDCCECGAIYPVTRGVPRFVAAGDYATSFGYQWHWYRDVQMDSKNRSSTSDDSLLTTTGWSDADFKGRRVLDAGVGAGRFAERSAAHGAAVYGVDLTQAIDAAYRNIGH